MQPIPDISTRNTTGVVIFFRADVRVCAKITCFFRISSSGHLWTIFNPKILKRALLFLWFCSIRSIRSNLNLSAKNANFFLRKLHEFLIEKERYLLSVSRYIHLNPVRAFIVKRPEDCRWSSYPEYIRKRKNKEWLNCDWILGQYSEEKAKAKRLYKKFVE